jgi:hypothetical protein
MGKCANCNKPAGNYFYCKKCEDGATTYKNSYEKNKKNAIEEKIKMQNQKMQCRNCF